MSENHNVNVPGLINLADIESLEPVHKWIDDIEYDRIVDGILDKARKMPKRGHLAYQAYSKCKQMHHDEIGFLWGDPRYDKFINKLAGVLGL